VKLLKVPVSSWLSMASASVLLVGFILIGAYAFATPGPHVQYLGVGLLTAFAAYVTGCLFGFLFGIPKVVSSGELRHKGEDKSPTVSLKPSTDGTVTASPAGEFTPSTNLSEVSDWLTKLLLGAGLVQLTHLGGPLGGLIDAVAQGLGQVPAGATPSGMARVVAGALLVTYVVVGFLSGYVVTTLWYGRRLREV
jgi:hypothetical protein